MKFSQDEGGYCGNYTKCNFMVYWTWRDLFRSHCNAGHRIGMPGRNFQKCYECSENRNRPDRFKYDYRLLRPGDAASDRSTFPAPQCRLFHCGYWLWKLYGRLELGRSSVGNFRNFGGEYSLCDTQIDADTVGGYVEYLAR